MSTIIVVRRGRDRRQGQGRGQGAGTGAGGRDRGGDLTEVALVAGVRLFFQMCDCGSLHVLSKAIPLNLAEGAGRSGKDKTYHYKIAYASAGETLAALEILLAYEAINDRQFESIAKQIDEIRAITWRLIQR